ncbi:hypothetical protein AA102526_1734 [Asaia lannensis NBRC 102526]|nr:hypothetical protein AA102526_1734 [Asaia lannensis NBRC 102526]
MRIVGGKGLILAYFHSVRVALKPPKSLIVQSEIEMTPRLILHRGVLFFLRTRPTQIEANMLS